MPGADEKSVDRVLLGTLLVVFGATSVAWHVDPLVRALALLGVLLPKARKSAHFWLGIVSLLAFGIWGQWYSVDNHMYLLGYVCLLCWRAVSSEGESGIQKNASGLLALVMALAVLWKLLSPDYLSGAFFEQTLLLDPRFTPLASGVCQLSLGALESNAEVVREASAAFDGAAYQVPLHSNSCIPALGTAMAVWTILIEGALAVLFGAYRLEVLRGKWKTLRNASLAAFIATTYPVAPVVGFGWLLSVLGFAQCESDEKKWKTLFMVLFAAIAAFELDWYRILFGL